MPNRYRELAEALVHYLPHLVVQDLVAVLAEGGSGPLCHEIILILGFPEAAGFTTTKQ